MRSISIICFILGLFCLPCFADIQFGDNPLYDALLYPVSLSMKDGSTMQGHVDLYPYQDNHKYSTKPIDEGTDVLALLKQNYPNQSTLGIYTQLMEPDGIWVAKKSALQQIPWKQIETVTLDTYFNDDDHFSKDNNPDIVHLNCGATLDDQAYELLSSKHCGSMKVPDSMGDIVLFSTNPEVQQIDLYILGALMVTDYDVSGYECHPYLNSETAYQLDNVIQYELWDYDEEAYHELRQNLMNCRQSWMDIVTKLGDNPYILPEMRAVCMNRMYNLASLCDTRLAELEGFYRERPQIPRSAQQLYSQLLGECMFPSITFPAIDDVDWNNELQAKGIVTVYLQVD